MKKIIISIIVLIFSFVFFLEYRYSKIQYPITKEFVVIEKNENIYNIYDKLDIPYNIFDKIYFKFIKKPFVIPVGKIKMESITTKKHLIEDLIINPKLIKLTIPEGFTTEKVLNRIEALGLASKSEMLEEMKNYEFYYKHDDNFEGYFYPETYYFTNANTPKDILDKIFNKFLEVFPPSKYDSNEMYEYLKMASIIEWEAKHDVDRPKIAAVFYNRLNKNMKLQSDATLKYHLDRKVYKRFNGSKSDYNTYHNKGNIPTPINNPSYESIMAAIYPEKDFSYLYFFTDKKEIHIILWLMMSI